MNTAIRQTTETPWERAKMAEIMRADAAAFGRASPCWPTPSSRRAACAGRRGSAARTRRRCEPERPLRTDEPPRLRRRLESIEELPPFKTEVQVEKPRTIITRNRSPTFPSIARSARIAAANARLRLLLRAADPQLYGPVARARLQIEAVRQARCRAAPGKELAKDSYKPRTIAIGTNTDPYQPIERQYRIMREVLEVLEASPTRSAS